MPVLRFLFVCFALIGGSNPAFGQTAGTNPLVRFHTDLGDIDVLLLRDIAPNNVANFLSYVNGAIYDGSFVHRSEPGFVIQGGGYKFSNGVVNSLPAGPAVVNEFHVSNTRGTVAMAKLPNNPNSATNQWFFNLSDSNAPNLDTQDGGFTVFGRILSNTGLATIDAIAAVKTYAFQSPFDSWPLRNYTRGNTVKNVNTVHVIWIKVLPQITALTHPSAATVHAQGQGAANMAYNLQTSSSLTASTFITARTVTTDSSGNISYDDTNAGTKKFYRLTIP